MLETPRRGLATIETCTLATDRRARRALDPGQVYQSPDVEDVHQVISPIGISARYSALPRALLAQGGFWVTEAVRAPVARRWHP